MNTADLSRFSINQMTVKQLSLPELTAACRKLGVPGVGLWRDPVQRYGVAEAAKLVRDAGLTVTTLCRGGFLTAIDPAERTAALADNRAAVDEAAVLGTDTLVLVSGGLPAGSKDLHGARERIADALAELGPYAAERGVCLAIEPLHPMYAADRCVISTLTQALDLAERFPAEQVGVAVDTYHVWWDDQAPAQVARAGRNEGVLSGGGGGRVTGEQGCLGGALSGGGGGRVTGEQGCLGGALSGGGGGRVTGEQGCLGGALSGGGGGRVTGEQGCLGGALSGGGGGRVTGEQGCLGGALSGGGGGRVTGGRIRTFQLADWTTPLPEGVLNGRGQIGDGFVDMRAWRERVEAAGYRGPIEVELFNEGLWARDGEEVLGETVRRFVEHVLGPRP